MPRVSYASVSTVKPDRLGDAIEMARQAAKLIGRHGAECRLLAAQLAGEQTGRLVFVVQLESVERAAVASEAMNDDPEMTEFMDSLGRSTSPIVLLSSSMSIEIPLPGNLPQGRGSVVEVHITKPAAGRFEESIEEAGKAGAVWAQAGAVGIQAFQMRYGGLQSGSAGLAVEWPSTKSQLLSASIWETDPVGQALATAMMNGSSAAQLISSALYRDIPL